MSTQPFKIRTVITCTDLLKDIQHLSQEYNWCRGFWCWERKQAEPITYKLASNFFFHNQAAWIISY